MTTSIFARSSPFHESDDVGHSKQGIGVYHAWDFADPADNALWPGVFRIDENVDLKLHAWFPALERARPGINRKSRWSRVWTCNWRRPVATALRAVARDGSPAFARRGDLWRAKHRRGYKVFHD
jgi:hypothetical protein